MILMYHKVSPDAPTMWWVDVDSFYRHLHSLGDRKIVYLEDYDPSDPDQIVITFDGVYKNVLEYAAPLLHRFGYPFELFVTSDYIGGDNTFDTPEPFAEFASHDDLKQLVAMGGRLQWHTRSHVNLAKVDAPELIAKELEIPEDVRQLDPAGFDWFAYPHGEYNEAVLSAVRLRYKGALSCTQGNDIDRHLLNRVTATSQLSLRRARISVIIASYNYGRFLVEAIESVLRQSISPDEIQISDDSSTDDTWDITEEYRRRYPELIKTNRNPANLGIVAHFNKAISLTTGEYICILGADNRYRSDFLESTAALLDANPEVAVAYTDFALFGPRAEIIASEMATAWPVKKCSDKFHIVEFPEFNQTSAELLRTNNNFIHGSSLFRRSAFVGVGGYQSEKHRPEDYSLFMRMIDAGWKAKHSPKPLLEYRQHSRDQANIRFASEVFIHHYRQEIQRLRQENSELLNYIGRTRSSFAWRLATPVRVAENIFRKWIHPKQST